MVPNPNSNGLRIDHLDASAAETHFRHIIDQLHTMRPSLDAQRYMEVDSVEVNNHIGEGFYGARTSASSVEPRGREAQENERAIHDVEDWDLV